MKKILLISLFFLMAFLEGNATTYYSDGAAGAGIDPADVTELANWTTDPTATSYTPAENPPNFTNPGDVFRVINSGIMTSTVIWTLNPTSTFFLGSGADFNSGGFNHTFILNMASGAVYRKTGASYSNLSLDPGMSNTSNFSMEGSAFRPLNYPCNLNFVSGANTLTSATFNTLTVGGNLNILGGTVRGSAANNGIVNITGNINISSGTFTGAINTGNPTFTCVNLNYSGGTFIGSTSSGSATFTLSGNLSLIGSSYTAKTSTGNITYNLNSTGGTIAGTTFTNSDHIVNLNGRYTLAANFTVGNTLFLNSAYVLNLSTFKATLGGAFTIVGTGGTFNGTSGTLEFASSTVSTNLSAVSVNSLIINSPGQTVTMTNVVTVGTGGLFLTNGTLDIGSSNNLILNGGISGGATLLGGTNSSIIVSSPGSGTISSFPAVTISNLSINRTGGVTLAGNVTVSGTLTLTSGTLDNSTSSLTMGNGASIIRNDIGIDGSLTSSPTFSGQVNVSYTGTEAITTGNELPSSTSALNNLTMNNSTTVTVSSPKTVNGALTLTQGTLASGAGNLTMNLNSGYISNATVVNIPPGIISGNINCAKTASRSGYHMLSSPVQGSPSFPATTFFKYYNEPTHDRISTGDLGYTSVSPTSLSVGSSTIGRGYVGNYPGGSTALNLTGSYAHNTDYSLAVSKTAGFGDTDAQNGWNLIGNPFPSVLDWDGVRADNSSLVDAQCHYYDGTGYVAYAGGVPATGGLGYLPPFQAVFIKKTNMGSGNLNINNARRLGSTKSLARTAKIDNVLEISIDNGTVNDKTYLRLHPEATNSFDSKFDANKLNNTSSILPNINTVFNNFRYSINTMNTDSLIGVMIPLKLTVPTSGSYNLKFKEEAELDNGLTIYLHDKVKNVVQDVRLNPLYNITTVKGDTTARFFISIEGSVTGLEETNVNSVISSHFDNRMINSYFRNIDSKTADFSLYNSMGQELFNKKNVNITSGKYSFAPEIDANGVYILKITTDKKSYTQRILLNY